MSFWITGKPKRKYMEVNVHNVYVFDVEYNQDDPEKKYIAVTFKNSDEETHREFIFLTEKARWKMDNFCAALGFTENQEIRNPKQFIGMNLTIELVPGKTFYDENNMPQSYPKVKRFFPMNDGAKTNQDHQTTTTPNGNRSSAHRGNGGNGGNGNGRRYPQNQSPPNHGNAGFNHVQRNQNQTGGNGNGSLPNQTPPNQNQPPKQTNADLPADPYQDPSYDPTQQPGHYANPNTASPQGPFTDEEGGYQGPPPQENQGSQGFHDSDPF